MGTFEQELKELGVEVVKLNPPTGYIVNNMHTVSKEGFKTALAKLKREVVYHYDQPDLIINMTLQVDRETFWFSDQGALIGVTVEGE